jgi:hypothetical protein
MRLDPGEGTGDSDVHAVGRRVLSVGCSEVRELGGELVVDAGLLEPLRKVTNVTTCVLRQRSRRILKLQRLVLLAIATQPVASEGKVGERAERYRTERSRRKQILDGASRQRRPEGPLKGARSHGGISRRGT